MPRAADATGIAAYSGRALGSALRLFVHLPPGNAGGGVAAQAADRAWAEVQDEFDAVDRALSRFRVDSELTALNRLAGTGGVVDVSWRLREMLTAIHRAGRMTDGRFDASVLGALERIGEHGAPLDGASAGSSVGSSAGASVGSSAGASVGSSAGASVGSSAGPTAGPSAGSSSGATVRPARAPADLERARRVRVPAVPVDSGGIGKGLALRWASARAVRALPAGAGLLLDAGGDVTAAGQAPEDGWRVGIEDPVAADDRIAAEPVAVVNVVRGAIATSSVRVRRWTAPDGTAVHHLLDPRTARPARTGLIAVTVAAPDPAWAEVWTKALFLAGRRAIGDEARARGLAAWWVDEDGRLGMTPEARLRSAWVAEARLG